MNIQSFSDQHRLHTKVDECGEKIIPGRYGHIYEYGSGRFGVMLMFKTAKKWGNSRRRMEAAGLEITLDCDTEGTALFDPASKSQAKWAIRESRIKRIRNLDPQDLENRRKLIAEVNRRRSSTSRTMENRQSLGSEQSEGG